MLCVQSDNMEEGIVRVHDPTTRPLKSLQRQKTSGSLMPMLYLDNMEEGTVRVHDPTTRPLKSLQRENIRITYARCV